MPVRIIISGGGTGGHIFPAISIARALEQLEPGIELLFVGALGRMEMTKVAAAGYRITGLPVSGFHRSFTPANVKVLYQLCLSLWKARKLIREFKPQAAVGVGGYVSAPVLKIASLSGVPTVIQEQNSYAGMTNKWLAAKARKICVAYPGMEKFFPADRIILTGNPVRQEIEMNQSTREEACRHFGLDPAGKILLVLGGSLGARTINESMKGVCRQKDAETQIIWQTGERYYQEMTGLYGQKDPKIVIKDFIQRMDLAYAAADLIVSRAGAGTISELCIVRKACILIPSPNVAEDHQTHNALSLVNRGAACLIPDAEAESALSAKVKELLDNESVRKQMSEKIHELAEFHSAERIAREVLSIIKTN